MWGSHPTNYLPPGRKSLADEAAGGRVTNEGNKDTNPRRRAKPMRLENQELEMVEVRSDLSARDLWEVEDYFRKQGVSEFIYDEPIDVFRFPEDGRFAFCDTFADWERLQERGYLHLLDEYRDDLKKVFERVHELRRTLFLGTTLQRLRRPTA